MLKNFTLVFPFITVLLLTSLFMMAQNTGKPVPSPAGKYKKPLVKTWLGKVTGTQVLSAEDAGQLLIIPLKIVDEKNNDYKISSYQFAYMRIGVTEEEGTGKTSPQSSMVSDRFTTTTLPVVWQKNITDGLHAGEQLYFFDVIVFDKQGRRFFAPDLKINIQ